MKVQMEISDVALRKVTAMLMLMADKDEIEQVESAIKQVKEATEPILLDISLFGEEKEKLEVALLSALIHQMMKEERP